MTTFFKFFGKSIKYFIGFFLLLLVISPIDFIPDFIPFFGQIDDGIEIVLLVLMFHKELGIELFEKKE